MTSEHQRQTIPAQRIRTGDVVLRPSATRDSIVTQVTNCDEEIHVVYTRGSAVMNCRTPVQISRRLRTIDHDATTVVFSSGNF